MESKFPIGKIMGLAIAVPFLFTLAIVILIVIILGSPPEDKNLGYTLAYLTPINQQAEANGVPPLWAIADIAWESGGYWKAVNVNNNGTMDAGLCQINSINWASYDLIDNPFDVNKNIMAGQKILGNAFKQYGNIEDALYAYNGGTPSNGRKYNPDYVPKVSSKYALLKNGPTLNVSVYDYNEQSLTLIIGEAERESHTTGEHSNDPGRERFETIGFFNPLCIYVKVADKTGVIKLSEVVVYPSAGDGITFPTEATLYKVDGTSFNKGDVVYFKTTTIYDSKSTQITLN